MGSWEGGGSTLPRLSNLTGSPRLTHYLEEKKERHTDIPNPRTFRRQPDFSLFERQMSGLSDQGRTLTATDSSAGMGLGLRKSAK